MNRNKLDILHNNCLEATDALRRGLKEFSLEREIDWRKLGGKSVDSMSVQEMLRTVVYLKRIMSTGNWH